MSEIKVTTVAEKTVKFKCGEFGGACVIKEAEVSQGLVMSAASERYYVFDKVLTRAQILQARDLFVAMAMNATRSAETEGA